MAERRKLDEQWYRRNIDRSGDLNFHVGPISNIERQREIPVTVAFGALVRLERRNKQLSVAQLAKQLRIEEQEVRMIEHDASYRARPRTIISIAREFGLPDQEVMKLAGAASNADSDFQQEALKFAAHSDDMGALTKDEREMLNTFVQYLKEKAKV